MGSVDEGCAEVGGHGAGDPGTAYLIRHVHAERESGAVCEQERVRLLHGHGELEGGNDVLERLAVDAVHAVLKIRENFHVQAIGAVAADGQVRGALCALGRHGGRRH